MHNLISIFFAQKTAAPQPGPSKKKEHALKTVFIVQNSSEDQPETSNKKQRIEEDIPLQVMLSNKFVSAFNKRL